MISIHEPTGGRSVARPVSLADIEAGAFLYSAAYRELSQAVTALETELQAIRAKHLPKLRSLVDRTTNAKDALEADVVAAPGLFTKPRTVIFHGIKVGYAKSKGKLEISDEAATLKRLEAMFPNESQRGLYLHVKVSPNKETLEELPASDLKRLGITIADDEDKVVIKCTDSDLEKFIAALLKDSEAIDARV